MSRNGLCARDISRRRLLVGASCFLLALTNCLSPALPLPPPGSPIVSVPSSNGDISIIGRVPATSTAFAHNLSSGQIVGQVTDETGDYELALKGEVDDTLSIYYEEGLDTSASVLIRVPGPVPASE